MYDGVVYADASAALGIVQRRGIGKVRHIRTQSLWLQEAHATKRLAYEKIDGSRNPSDLMTKHLTDTLQQRHLNYMSTHAVSGRAETAPTLSILEGDHDRYFLGNIQEESIVSALMKRRAGIRRRKNVAFSPLVSVHYICPYSEVYSRHPREFVFDALGRYVSTSTVVPKFLARESRVGEATDPIRHPPVSLLSTCGVRSQEEECKYSTGRLGRIRQAQSHRARRGTEGHTHERRKQSVG